MHRVDLGTPVLSPPSPALSLRQMLPRASEVDHAKREAEDSNTFEHSFALVSRKTPGRIFEYFRIISPANSRISGEIQEYIRTLVLKSSRDVLKISSSFEEKI